MTEITQDNTIYIEEERLKAISTLAGRALARKFIRKAQARLMRQDWSAGTCARPSYFDMLDDSVKAELIDAIEMIMFEVPLAVGEDGQYTRYKYYVLRWNEVFDTFTVNAAYVE